MGFTEKLLYVVVYKIDSFWNSSAHASNHGNRFKTYGQVSFNTMFSLLSNKPQHFPSIFG